MPRFGNLDRRTPWGGDMRGYGDDHEVVDRAEAETAVGVLADLFGRMKG